jgi:hypothetical protein
MSDWKAQFGLDIETARTAAFESLIADFDKWAKTQEIGELPLKSGWHDISPELAEQMLLRNPVGANRKVVPTTVLYYAKQMKRGDWPRTGQPIIFGSDGSLKDGQHRLFAGYLSGTVFSTYVVTDVPDHPRLFAYLDNGKARTPANALQTAGLNGVSPVIVKIVDMAICYENGYYTPTKVQAHDRLSPVEYLDAVANYPGIQQAARLAVSEYDAASDLADRDVIGFAYMVINNLHGETVAKDFMEELSGIVNIEDDSPVAALITLLKENKLLVQRQLKRHQKLGNVILAFNAWVAGEKIKQTKRGTKSGKWSLTTDERFPHFDAAPDPVDQAAA